MTTPKDRARALVQSTPLRLAVALVILFAVVSLLSLGASYLIIRDSFQTTMETDLRQELAGFQAAPSAGALAQLISAQGAATDPERRILSYRSPDGRYFGNGVISKSGEGFRVLSFPEGEDLSEDPYLALTANLHGGQLTIANSREQIEELGELFLNILLLSVLPTTAIALAAGLVISRRSGRRIEAVGRTLERLTDGDLSARVGKMPGRADDLSTISVQVDRMAAAQQSSTNALRQVSADIAHDLKTPIQRVAVLLNRARELPDLPDEIGTILDQAGQETAGIVATFQSLLQIAQIEGGSPRNRFQPVDLGALAATLVEVYEPSAEESGHALTLSNTHNGAVEVLGDKVLLGQVLANLIENALRHTPTGSGIAVALRKTATSVTLSVADDGPGIPTQERDKVLRRLYRLEQSRTTPGSGLGLSLVAVIADLHDARLELGDNHPGLIVKLAFPAVPGKGQA
ncbi:ATP-binding protein [Fluviibacterium sp. S390]|uniref:HAMP domain-containing sensor histidine kinase n=1 Tax=Fluviibacterium sp. S390 TaxID=3415139 RepID=UPI003C7C3AC3